MNNKFLLSICIPTYNRASYLKDCLDNIVCQFDNETVKNLIEIVVSDNASSDDTKKIVEDYQIKFGNIKYFRNQENIGMDENILNSVLKSNGKYCWHIGDDDFIRNGTLKFLIELLLKKDIALLSVNFYPYIDIKKSREKIDKIREDEIKFFQSPEEFYSKGYCQGILGIFIFNKELWLKIDRRNYEKYWSYYEIILKMIGATSLPLAYIEHPLLFIGQDYRWNEGGTALFILIHSKRFIKKLENFGYTKNFIDSEMDRLANNLFATILSAKSYNLKCSFKNLSLIYKEFLNYPSKIFLTTIVFFIPNYFIKFAKNTRKNLIKKNV